MIKLTATITGDTAVLSSFSSYYYNIISAFAASMSKPTNSLTLGGFSLREGLISIECLITLNSNDISTNDFTLLINDVGTALTALSIPGLTIVSYSGTY